MIGERSGFGLVLVAACLVFHGAPVVAQSAAAERNAWAQPVEPYRVVGDVWYVGATGVSAFLIATSDGLVLLDGGLPEMAPQIAASIAALGFRLGDVKLLLNSHAHFDHAGGLAELQRRTGARMVASHGDAPALRAGGPDMAPIAIDRLVSDGDTVQLGNAVLLAHITPGHTRGCTTWATTTIEAGRTYRVVFHCSTSVVEPLVENTRYPDIVDDYIRTFARLRTLTADVFLANHPDFMAMSDKLARRRDGAPNPFIDPGELPRFVERSERAFRAELERQQAVQ